MPSFTRRVPERTGTGRAFASVSQSQSQSQSSTPSTPSATTPSATSASKPSSTASTSTSAPAAKQASASTGIGSLNDVLGTFAPGSTLLLLAPDAHTAWSRLVARHVAAQGLLEGARVVVAASDPGAWVKGVVWTADSEGEGVESAVGGAGAGGKSVESKDAGDAGEDEGDKTDERAADTNERGFADRRIAWRYDALTFETTVGTTALDASRTLPPALRARAEAERRLISSPFDSDDGGMGCLAAIASALDETPSPSSGVARVVVEVSPEHEFDPARLVRFLLALRALLRPRAAVGVITLPPRLSSSSSSSSASPSSSYSYSSTAPAAPPPEWINTLAHAADATLTLAGFGTNPLAAAYAPAHGLLTPHALDARGHILAPALRHSTLLGISGGSEHNLGFRLKRRRWVVETVHLGIEGGGSERRTEPVKSVKPVQQEAAVEVEGIEPAVPKAAVEEKKAEVKVKEKKPRARVRFGDDDVVAVSHDSGNSHQHHDGCGHRPASSAPKIAIRHDRPDLYEF